MKKNQIILFLIIQINTIGFSQNLYTLAESYGANGDDANEKQFKSTNLL